MIIYHESCVPNLDSWNCTCQWAMISLDSKWEMLAFEKAHAKYVKLETLNPLGKLQYSQPKNSWGKT